MYKQDRCGCQCQKYAMAEVPMQQWGDLYDWYTALCNGTIFPDLNLEFWSTVNMPCPPKNCNTKQEALMMEINQISFAVNDLTLYLDTHPDCMQGMELFSKLQERRVQLLEEYGRLYYPLTIDTMLGRAADSSSFSSAWLTRQYCRTSSILRNSTAKGFCPRCLICRIFATAGGFAALAHR